MPGCQLGGGDGDTYVACLACSKFYVACSKFTPHNSLVTRRALPPQLREGMSFFRAALEERVICVPGLFFDINPVQRRPDRPSRFRNHVRFSFGPPAEQLKAGIERLSGLVQRARSSAG